MATVITTINAGDQITNSRTDINNNFASLNTNKIETSVIDTDTTLAANSDSNLPSQKAVKAYVDAGGNVNASTTQKGIVEEATAAEILSGSATGGTGARLYVNPAQLASTGGVKFGGTGADGALSISSGTTTLSAASATYLVKNYSSISITGTGVLAFSNPGTNGTIIILKSSGNVTLSSSATPMINTMNMGAAGGAGQTSASGSANTTAGTDGYSDFGTVGSAIGGASPAAGVFTPNSASVNTFPLNGIAARYPYAATGAGGGAGGYAINIGGGTLTSGAGGRGGGALIIECTGTFTFTTSGGLSISGTVGADGVNNGISKGTAAGGGGGGNGTLQIFYLTAGTITGTVTTTAAIAGVLMSVGSSPTNSATGFGGATLFANAATTTGGGGIANYIISIYA